MTRDGALDTARAAAVRFGKAFRAYRLPGWPAGVYGATALDLPKEAEVLETCAPQARPPAPAPAPASGVDAPPGQGSLFS